MNKLNRNFFGPTLIVMLILSGRLSANDEQTTWQKISRHVSDNKITYLCMGAVCVAGAATALAYYFGTNENSSLEDYCPDEIANPCFVQRGEVRIDLGPLSKPGYNEYLALMEDCLDDSGRKCLQSPSLFELNYYQFSFNSEECGIDGIRTIEGSFLKETGNDCEYDLYLEKKGIFKKIGSLFFEIIRFRRD